MNRLHLFAILGLLSASAGAAAAGSPAGSAGTAALNAAFDPNRIFMGDIVAHTNDQLILTAWASARDDYAPAYSLAIAYRCFAAEKRCGYTARMLRARGTDDNGRQLSLRLAGQARTAESASEMKQILDDADLQWIEADVDACPKGIFAMDSVRVADWRPDIHYALQALEDREVIIDPAAIRVRMTGTYATSTYEGWVGADGVPAAVRQLIQTLEPCWKPATSPRPWNRR